MLAGFEVPLCQLSTTWPTFSWLSRGVEVFWFLEMGVWCVSISPPWSFCFG